MHTPRPRPTLRTLVIVAVLTAGAFLVGLFWGRSLPLSTQALPTLAAIGLLVLAFAIAYYHVRRSRKS